MRMQLPMGLSRVGGAAASLSAQVQAILSGTAGFALDPTDVSTMWQDTGTVTPVATIADPVGHIRSKWGTTTRDLTQATGAARPAWNGSSLTFDGTDDRLFLGSSDILQNVPAAFLCARVRYDAWPGTQGYMIWVAASAAANPRFALRVDDPGTAFQLRRRANADATSSLATASGEFAAGVANTITSELDYLTGPANIWKNGSLLVNNTLAGAANTENVASAQFSVGSSNIPAFYVQGRIGRMVLLPFIPSAGQRSTIEAWVAEVAL